MGWTVIFRENAQKAFYKLDGVAQRKIQRFITQKIESAKDPRVFAEPLRYEWQSLWRFRIGKYRLICRIEDKRLVVLVIRIGHRSDVYESRQ